MTTRSSVWFDRVAIALFALCSAATAAVYSRLPPQIPVHFDLYGRADGWVSKAVGAPLLLVIAALTWALVRFGAHALPEAARDRYRRSPMDAAALLTAVFLLGVHGCVIAASLGEPRFGRSFGVLLGAFWMVLGLLMPRIRRNPFVGIRVRWTMRSDEIWARAHRLAGQVCFASGAVAVVAALLGSMPVAIGAVVASAIVPVVYAWRLSR